ncbi:hypothetical protein [Streptomyces chattanoogensis]|uniref:Uncharacterized protein n=1 Tax=Streptomyces chattanoogensis TaxID=66876 RepID=A0A0N0XV04_9ACTN|nr:hypothetical protein ADL29_18710 [Streptomyces chattanoogensis]
MGDIDPSARTVEVHGILQAAQHGLKVLGVGVPMEGTAPSVWRTMRRSPPSVAVLLRRQQDETL